MKAFLKHRIPTVVNSKKSLILIQSEEHFWLGLALIFDTRNKTGPATLVESSRKRLSVESSPANIFL